MLIPSIDLLGGQIVQLVQGEKLKLAFDDFEYWINRFSSYPLVQLIDLDAAMGQGDNSALVTQISKQLPVQVGGGIRTTDDIRNLLLAGADKASINSAAVADREIVRLAAEKFGAQCVVVAIDAKRVSAPGAPLRWEIFTHGGRRATGIEAIGYAREIAALGAGEILLTSMDRDGSKQGFDLELTRAVADAVAIPVIASGGVGSLDHLVDGVRQGRASAVLAASIFHFGEFTIRQAKARMAEAGVPVRMD